MANRSREWIKLNKPTTPKKSKGIAILNKQGQPIKDRTEISTTIIKYWHRAKSLGYKGAIILFDIEFFSVVEEESFRLFSSNPEFNRLKMQPIRDFEVPACGISISIPD